MTTRILVAAMLCAAASAADWRVPPGARVQAEPDGTGWKFTSKQSGEFDLTSGSEIEARPGDTFEVQVRFRLDTHTRAMPDLACYDREGREIAVSSPLSSGPPTQTTNWQSFRHTFPVRPGTARVRARLHVEGQGELRVAELKFGPARADAYQTGALITQIYPGLRRGLVLESNLGVVNRELLSDNDEDGDGKWAVITVDVDRLSHPEQRGVDWRTRFQYRPDVIYWSDGAVLKSDTVREDRQPDFAKAIYFRMKAHRGPYRAILSDPGRAVAISIDGRTWKRFEGGAEAELGRLEAAGGFVELWVDACYRDPVSVGPAYFDYVRLFPIDHAASAVRLFESARQKPSRLTRGRIDEKRVDFRFDAPAFASGTAWPARLGIPIPQGELASPDRARIIDSRGSAVASQNRALATWPDGSIKWLFIDFLFDPRTTGERRWSLLYGNRVTPVPPPARALAREVEAGVEVDNGAIRFLVPKSRYGLLENVASSGRMIQKEPVSIEVGESGGRTWRSLELPSAKLEIEQAGPLHAVVVAESSWPAGTGFIQRARIHAYAGSPLVEVDFFIANADSRPRLKVRSISLDLAPAGRGVSSDAFVVSKEGDSAPGWAGLGGDADIAAGIADFREQYPKALRSSPGQLRLDLWAPEGGDYDWVQGVGKTHHIALWYGPAPGDGALLAAGPVLGRAEPEWYAASGAFGPIATAGVSPLPEVEQTLKAHMTERVVGKVGLGFENYGDHSSSGYVQGSYLWDNNEYDLPAAAIVHFARTGDASALRLGLASALHYADVDTIHYSSTNPEWVGAPHTHSHGTVGHHTADKPGMHHAGYVQGLILYTYITGDPAGLRGARGIADWVLRSMRPESSIGQMERATGHPLMTLNDVYEATWQDRYLEGSARLVDWAMKWEDPVRGGFPAPITEQPAYYSGSPFCGGLLTSALMKFNGWARDPEIDAMLERAARWALTDMWRPPGGLMSKGGPVTRDASPGHISSHLRLMSLEVSRTGDPLFLAVPRAALIAGYGTGEEDIGTRSTGLVYNYLPWFLRVLADEGNPSPDPQLEVTLSPQTLELSPGGSGRACAEVQNKGHQSIEGLRVSFQPRLDMAVVSAAQAPPVLNAGQETRLCYEIRAPERINLTSEHNRISYGHWSASYKRAGSPELAHRWFKLVLPTGTR